MASTSDRDQFATSRTLNASVMDGTGTCLAADGCRISRHWVENYALVVKLGVNIALPICGMHLLKADLRDAVKLSVTVSASKHQSLEYAEV